MSERNLDQLCEVEPRSVFSDLATKFSQLEPSILIYQLTTTLQAANICNVTFRLLQCGAHELDEIIAVLQSVVGCALAVGYLHVVQCLVVELLKVGAVPVEIREVRLEIDPVRVMCVSA